MGWSRPAWPGRPSLPVKEDGGEGRGEVKRQRAVGAGNYVPPEMDVKVGERHFISFPAARWRGVTENRSRGLGRAKGSPSLSILGIRESATIGQWSNFPRPKHLFRSANPFRPFTRIKNA